MPISPEQRRRVLEAIGDGRLRLEAPTRMYAGYGAGRSCHGCGDTIGPRDVEYEADYDDGGTSYLHLGCAGLLDAERRRRDDSALDDARMTRQQSEAKREQARLASKHSAQLRDQADVLARESEAAIDRARQVKRGQPPGI
jgi:hypothetical protein